MSTFNKLFCEELYLKGELLNFDPDQIIQIVTDKFNEYIAANPPQDPSGNPIPDSYIINLITVEIAKLNLSKYALKTTLDALQVAFDAYKALDHVKTETIIVNSLTPSVTTLLNATPVDPHIKYFYKPFVTEIDHEFHDSTGELLAKFYAGQLQSVKFHKCGTKYIV
jgi:hypothetical protein